jgi:sulfhydrogenase subunit beta (sulfur reductase)
MPEAAIDQAGLDQLFAALERRGYTVVGPTVRDRAIVLEGQDFRAGDELSAPVRAAVKAVRAELRGRLGKSAADGRQDPDGGAPARD